MFLDDGHTGEPLEPDGDAGWDPGSSLWLSGVDYLAAWRVAKNTADMLNEVLTAHGLTREQAWAVAVSPADGSASVEIRMSVNGAGLITAALKRASRRAA